MGFLDRLFGTNSDEEYRRTTDQVRQASAERNQDEIAVERYRYLLRTASPEAIEQVTQLFKSMAEQEQKDNCGQLPDFVQDTHGDYFYNISQDNESAGVFQYETKWSPNTEIMLRATFQPEPRCGNPLAV